MFEIVQMIVNTVAYILGGVLLLRFWMQAIRVRPTASVAQVTFTMSDWLVRPLRRIVPGVGGYDWASLLGALMVIMLASSVLLLVGFGWMDVVKMGFYRFLTGILYGFMLLMFIDVIFSWVNPHAPAAPFVHALNTPLLRPLRRVIPPIGGLDLSFLVAVLLLQIAAHLVKMMFGYA